MCKRRIGTLNCGHAAFPVILGVNRPQYTPEELEKLRADNEKGVTVDGAHYTGYETAQMQRKLERAIRARKRRVMVDEAAGDEEKLARDRTRLTVLRQRYQEFSDRAGLRTREERTEVAGFGERWSCDPDGTTEKVPADMTCEERRERFVNDEKPELTFDGNDGKLVAGKSTAGPSPLTTEQVRQIMTDQVEALPDELKQALRNYTGNDAFQINSAIRNGRITPAIQKKIDLLDAALKDGVLPETVVLHRDTSLSFLGLGFSDKPTAEELSWIIGRNITNDIFTSTSFEDLGLPGRNTELWLTVPAGYHGCQYLPSVAFPKYVPQEEVLFARGMRYRVTDARIENGKYVLIAEVIQ